MSPKLRYGQLLVIGYGGLSLLGAVLLMLPWASVRPHSTTWLDAWFTAISALTVTGLTVVNTGGHWTTFGQAVILLLIQIGGLGLMVLSSIALVLLGLRMNLGHRVLATQEQEQFQLTGLAGLIRNITLLVLAIESIGTVLLYFLFPASLLPNPGGGVFFALFHAVSAFNGAGFDISGSSLLPFRESVGVNLVVMVMILLGSLGYMVLLELLGLTRRWRRLSLHSRLVLIVTAAITVLGSCFYFLTEQAGSLLGLSWSQQIVESLFQSATRTCGFVSVPVSSWSESFQFLMIIIMFIGASPGSVGGGIKTTTFAVIILSVWSLAAGKKEVVVMEREIDAESVRKAFTVTFFALIMICVGTLSLMMTDDIAMMPALFETVSALATAGLSTGITEHLSPFSKILLGLLMFVGRIGILSLVVLLAQTKPTRVHYMKEPIIIG